LDETDVQQFLRQRMNLSIEPEMTRYLARKSADATAPIPVIGADARTGVPRREILDPTPFRSEPS
jgi:hypothetical protein